MSIGPSFISRKGKRRPTMPSDTGLNGCGKGDSPRSCFSAEFRNNYDSIDWQVNSLEVRPSQWRGKWKRTYPHTLPNNE